MSPSMRPLLLTVATILALLGSVTSALAASGRDVVRDCTDDEVMSKTYTQREYKEALRIFAGAGDADQYGNCRDVIRRAQQAALVASRKPKGGDGGGGGSATSGGGPGAIGSAPAAEQVQSASKTERKALEEARTAPSGLVALDEATVDPAKVGTVPGISQVSDLPAPLVVLLALLLAGSLAVAALRVRRLVRTRRP